jgi:ABC-type phosphate transport system permease subunit
MREQNKKKGKSKFSQKEIKILMILGVAIFLAAIIGGTIQMIQNYDKRISKEECNTLTAKVVGNALKEQEQNPIIALIYRFELVISIFIGFTAVSWLIHGVGFKIIGR